MADVVSVFLCIDTGVISTSDVITTNHCLGLAEMKECQVGDWFVGI